MNEIKSINNIPIHDTVARASIAELEDKINNIEDNIDLSEYVTETYAESTYAKKADMPTKTSQLTNDSGFISVYGIPAYYVTETELESKNYIKLTDIPTNVSAFTNDKGYITNADLLEQNYAHKYDLPISVSELLNDRGYLTEADLIYKKYINETALEAKNYLTEDDVNELLENVNTEKLAHVFLTKEEYNALTDEEKNDESKLYIITDADEVDINSNNYATKAYVDNLIGDVGALLDTLNGEVI